MAFDDEGTLLAPSGPTATLTVRQGPQIGIQFPITGRHVVLGREETNDIVIQDAEVSRRHCQINRDGDEFTIQDLNSTNGTFINGSQITTPHILSNGDKVGLGQTTLLFEARAVVEIAENDYIAPDVVSEPPSSPVSPVEEPWLTPTRKWLLGGCGCLGLLCVCLATVTFVVQTMGIIDLSSFL